MTRSKANIIGWGLVALCGAGAVLMDTLRMQFVNFNLYVALCVAASAVCVFAFRRLYGSSIANPQETEKPTGE